MLSIIGSKVAHESNTYITDGVTEATLSGDDSNPAILSTRSEQGEEWSLASQLPAETQRGKQTLGHDNYAQNLPTLLQHRLIENLNVADKLDIAYATPELLPMFHKLTVPAPVKIKEHPNIDNFSAVMTFAGPLAQRRPPKFIFLFAFVVEVPSPFNRGQTWRLYDVLNFSKVLPRECWSRGYFLPSIALTQAQDRVIFYGFGLPSTCSKLVWYDPRSRTLALVKYNSQSWSGIPTLFTALAFKKVDDDSDMESLVLFGGLHCSKDPIIKCSNMSNRTFVFTFSSEEMKQGEWREANTFADQSKELVPRCSASLFDGPDDHMYMYGGISVVLVAGRRKSDPLKYIAECDLWQFQYSTGLWLKLTTLQHDCYIRMALDCLLPGSSYRSVSIPLVPISAYSKHRREVVVVTFPVIRNVLSGRRCRSERFNVYSFSLANSTINSKYWVSHSAERGIETPAGHSIFTSALVLDDEPEAIFLVSQRRLNLYIISYPPENCVQSTRSRTKPLSSRLLHDNPREYSFAGSAGCIAPAPVEIPVPDILKRESFEVLSVEATYIFLGGTCVRRVNSYDNFQVPVWRTTPVWTFIQSHSSLSVCDSRATCKRLRYTYQMRLVSPGPTPPIRIFHTVTQIKDSEWLAYYGGITSSLAGVSPELWCFNTQHFFWLNATIAEGCSTIVQGGQWSCICWPCGIPSA